MSQKVYVWTTGEYSSYHVKAVFSTRELAETAGAAADDIEEYTLDPGIDKYRAGRSLFEVEMFEDGRTVKVSDFGWAWDEDVLKDTISQQLTSTNPLTWGDLVLTAHVWATDESHAVKIANERRVKIIAAGQWKAGLVGA